MTLLKLAPWAQSWDFWALLFLCYLSSLIWLYRAYRASQSGSIITTFNELGHRIETPSDENIPIYKTGYFLFFCLHIVIGSVIFWATWADFHDVWFIK